MQRKGDIYVWLKIYYTIRTPQITVGGLWKQKGIEERKIEEATRRKEEENFKEKKKIESSH